MAHPDLYKLLDLIDRLMNETDEQREARFQFELERRRANMAKRNAKFADWLALASDVQAARMSKFMDDGYSAVKVWKSRSTGKVAVMLQKDGIWDQQTGRIRTKLIMCYPDGRYQEAFGKITVQSSWF